MARLIASEGAGLVRKKRSRSGALLGRPSCSVRLPGAHSPWPTSPGRPRPAAGLRLRQPLKRLGEVVPQDAIGAPLGHPGPSLSYPGQPRHVEDGRAPPQSARLAHLVGRRHRAALRRLGLPARARAEAAGGGGGQGRRVLRGEGRYNDGIERSAARLTSRRSLPRRKDAVLTLCCRSGGASHGRRPPPPPGGGSRQHRRLRGRRHLPRRHLFSSVDRCEQRSTSPPPSLPEVVFLCSAVAPQPAPPPPLTRATRSCRSLAAALRGRGVCSAAVRSARAGTCSPHASH